MPLYRIEFVSRVSGRVAHQYRFDASDDGAAIAFAGVWIEDAPMELWRGREKLKRWEDERQRG